MMVVIRLAKVVSTQHGSPSTSIRDPPSRESVFRAFGFRVSGVCA